MEQFNKIKQVVKDHKVEIAVASIAALSIGVILGVSMASDYVNPEIPAITDSDEPTDDTTVVSE